jgi:hypothetical protein
VSLGFGALYLAAVHSAIGAAALGTAFVSPCSRLAPVTAAAEIGQWTSSRFGWAGDLVIGIAIGRRRLARN